jgi:hypothetical protein
MGGRPCGLAPVLGDFRQQAQTGAHIFAALGVVGGGRQHGTGPPYLDVAARPVKRLDRGAEVGGVAAHFVERHQAVEGVERRVLHAFGHRRPGQLLEAHHQLGLEVASDTPQQDVAEEIEKIRIEVRADGFGRLDRRGRIPHVIVLHLVVLCSYVGTVYWEAGGHLAQRLVQLMARVVAITPMPLADVEEQSREAVDVAAQDVP